MEYRFDSGHHFFSEIAVLSTTIVGMYGVLGLARANAWIDDAVDHVQHRRPGNLSIPQIVVPEHLQGLGKITDCTLLNAKELTTALQESTPLPAIRYSDVGLVIPDIDPEDTLTVHPLPPGILDLTAQVALGSAYEGVSPRIAAKWGKNPHGWPVLLQYFRHVRNAASHRNRFTLRSYGGIPAIDPTAPPAWRSSVMPSDTSMNGLSLIGDWWDMGDVPIFLGDVDNELIANGITVPAP